MPALTVVRPDDFDFKAATTAELRELLDRSLGYTALGLLTAARAIQELESRGEDIPAIHAGIRSDLRKIAEGTLLPEVLIRFAGKPDLQRMIGRLPVSEQRRLVDGGPVRLLEFKANGETDVSLQDPSTLMPEQLRQVFGQTSLRSDAEQRNWLSAQRAKASRPRPDKLTEGKVVLNLDRERGGLSHRGEFIPLHLLVQAVRGLRK